MFYFTQEQLDQLKAAAEGSFNSDHPYADMYDMIFAAISNPTVPNITASVDTIAWFGAAAQANRGVGGASDFIRTYTENQILLRNGELPVNIDEIVQGASDKIAEQILESIEGTDIQVNGETVYVLPTALQIANIDVTAALDGLSAFTDSPGIWSGNPLFIGLGHADFWQKNIIDDPSDTYDFFASIASLTAAGFNPALWENGGISDLFELFLGQGFTGTLGAADAGASSFADTQEFFTQAYGPIGTNLGGILYSFASDILVGSESDDDILYPAYTPFHTDNDIVIGGSGNNTIFGSLGNDLLDGGGGNDTADFTSLSLYHFTVKITDVEKLSGLTSDYSANPFSAIVTSSNNYNAIGDSNSYLFNMESLVLGDGNDTVYIEEASSIQFIDAGAQDGAIGDPSLPPEIAFYGGDTLDFSLFDGSVQANLSGQKNGADVFFGVNQITISGFENLTGGAQGDELFGDKFNNSIDGGGGDDYLKGGQGDDFLVGGAGNDTLKGNLGTDELQGGLGDDILKGGKDTDYLSGDEGNDLVAGQDGDDVLYGGTGNDTIKGGIGNDVLFGGDDNDILNGGEGNDTLYSGNGDDVLKGGLGVDWFVFEDDFSGTKKLKDFEFGTDKIVINFDFLPLTQAESVFVEIPNPDPDAPPLIVEEEGPLEFYDSFTTTNGLTFTFTGTLTEEDFIFANFGGLPIGLPSPIDPPVDDVFM